MSQTKLNEVRLKSRGVYFVLIQCEAMCLLTQVKDQLLETVKHLKNSLLQIVNAFYFINLRGEKK